MKISQLLRNEVLAEPDTIKRLNYMPVPEILTDDPEKFNLEFVRAFDRGRFHVQIQTAGEGNHCEKKLPETLTDRITIALHFAKLLRTCSKNKIAYVDIKPLEHLFWAEQDGRLQITLIDWGISRLNAPAYLLSEDIRKFCLFLPEIIYGRKMLELINKGKFEYPIQKENDRILIRMLGRLSCSMNLPPLNQKFAVLLGEQLAGGTNEVRIQNRCVEVWDEIITILDEAFEASKGPVEYTGSWETLKKDADDLIQKENESLQGKDFLKSLEPRLISLSSYKAWLIPEIRFLQIWYGKIDLVPHREFEICINQIISGQPDQLENEFGKLFDLVMDKLSKNTSNPELVLQLKENLEAVRNVIQAWRMIYGLNSGEISDEEFHTKYNTSALRVVDPILSDAYKKQMKRMKEKSTVSIANESAETFISEKAVTPGNKNSLPQQVSSNMASEISNRVAALIATFEDSNNPAERWNFGFIQELNSVLQIVNQTNSFVEGRELEPILESMLQDVKTWTEKVGSETYIVSDEILHSINWLTTIPAGILETRIIRKTESIEIGQKIKDDLDMCLKNLTDLGGVVSQELFDRIGDKITRIKGLRKKIDAENLFRLRNTIESGDYTGANQTIDLHYMENPPLYDRLREEIIIRQNDDEDRKSMALVNTLLTDLSGNSGYPESGKLFKNQKNIPYLNQKIAEFRQKNIQLFDIQDELIRTKSLAHDSKKSLFGVKQVTRIILFLLVLVVILSIGLLTVILAKNYGMERNIARIENNVISFQNTYVAYENATELPSSTPLPETTMVPTVTIAASSIPTEVLTSVPVIELTTDAMLSPSDLHLKSLLGQKVVFDLDGNVDLFADEAMTPEKKLGTVINYAQSISGTLAGYTDTAVNLHAPFNIGRSQISISTYLNVARSTNIRQFSETQGKKSKLQ